MLVLTTDIDSIGVLEITNQLEIRSIYNIKNRVKHHRTSRFCEDELGLNSLPNMV